MISAAPLRYLGKCKSLRRGSQVISFGMRELPPGTGNFGNQIAQCTSNSTALHSFPSGIRYTFRMHFLLLDTADARGSIAVFRGAQLLSAEAYPGQEDFSAWLLPAVRRTLEENHLSLANLDGYAVCSGPGSFTGLRVGLTTVKAWAELYGKPI